VFAGGIERSAWAALTGDPLNPMSNRLIQGRYPPGSTFKIVMAIAALSEGVITPDYKVTCTGGAVHYGRFFQCLRSHGTMDVRHALEQSCNTFFYTLGEKLKIDTIHEYARKLGLVGRRALICREKSKASCRPPSGSSGCSSSRGIRARRFLSPSDRAPSR
jgi:penicillin-binding protein 2